MEWHVIIRHRKSKANTCKIKSYFFHIPRFEMPPQILELSPPPRKIQWHPQINKRIPAHLTMGVAPIYFNDYDNSNMPTLHVPNRNLCDNIPMLDVQRHSILCGTTPSDIASTIYPRLIVNYTLQKRLHNARSIQWQKRKQFDNPTKRNLIID
jgi:hypothetical protein